RLSVQLGIDLYLKLENLQHTNSFKSRGALAKLLSLDAAQKTAGVIACSAGNHAQGVAYHATRLGIPSTIVMPVTTPFNKVKHTRDHGARVILEGETLAEATEHAYSLRDKEGLTFIHPFDDADVIAGQGTIALEMMEAKAAPDFDVLIVPVGGGGLIGGIATAAKALNPDIKIIGVEAAMYPAMHAELGGNLPQVGGSTIAEGIAVKRAGRLNMEIARSLIDEVVLVEEAHLERAITLFADVEKVVAEGAGAAGLAAMLAHPAKFTGKRVGLVLCGGNIDLRLLASVLTRALVRENRISRIRIIGDDRPGLLGMVSNLIGRNGANILEVAHNRIALDVPAKGAEFDILMETRDAQHTREVIDALTQAGYPPREA
ncbi:MAG: threonine ammonia-lyase, partial [Pseudomonadota bacterium]